jgi:hypothetical protein
LGIGTKAFSAGFSRVGAWPAREPRSWGRHRRSDEPVWYPDTTNDQVTVSRNGLVQKTVSRSDLATTYAAGYDPVDR